MENKFDIGIVGCGPAGYTAALHAASSGKSVVIFEKDFVGGVCLNKGCIPTKSIIHSSEVFKQTKNCEEFGISAENINLDFSKVIDRKNKTVELLRKGLALAFKNAKITVVNSQAKIINKNLIQSNGKDYFCEKIICATGSKPKIVKGLEFDHKFLLSSDDILNLEKLPKSILIIGSGAIGIEWARIFNNFGVDVCIVELAPNLLPLADIDISKRLERNFKTNKIKFYTQTTVTSINNRKITLSNGEELTPEIVLVAIGRTPCKEDKIEGVTYLGDVSGEIQLAHYAIKQAIKEIDNIEFRKDLTPSVVYGTPEIAWIGKREQELEGEEYEKSTILVSYLGKAHCDSQTDGIIKLLIQQNKIVGAHIMSNEASSLIQQLTIAIQNNIGIEGLKKVCYAHPTYSEGIFEALFKI